MNRFFIGLLLVGALSACGGGGNSTPATQSTASPTPTPGQGTTGNATPAPLPATGTPTGNLASNATQQSIVSEGLAAASESNTITSLAESGGSLSRERRSVEQLMKTYHKGAQTLARVHPLAIPSVGPCEGGVESSTVDGPGADEEQITEDVFYDSVCTQIEEESFEDVVATSSTTGSVNATFDLFSASGAETGYIVQVLTLTDPTAGEEATITEAISATKGGAVYANVGASCGLGSGTLDCGAGSVFHQTTDSGVSLLFNATFNASTLTFSGSDQLYAGAANALSLAAGTFPAWNVSGNSPSGSATVSASFGTSSNGTITVTDATDGATLTLTVFSDPSVTQGVLRQTGSGTVAATFSINAVGDGTVSFSNGSTATVQNFIIQP